MKRCEYLLLVQRIKSLAEGVKLHLQLAASHRDRETFIGNSLVQMYGNLHSLGDARKAFDRIQGRNAYSWNIMLSVYSQSGQAHLAKECFELMPARDVVAWNVLLTASARKGHLQAVRSLFTSIPQRSKVTWNCLLSAVAKTGDYEAARSCIDRMPQWSEVPWLTMLSAYAQNGHVDSARDFFGQIPQRSVACWNCLLSVYARSGLETDVLKLFQLMDLDGVHPDPVTFTTIFTACASLTDLTIGRLVHAEATDAGVGQDTQASTALLNMYAKCGSLQDARQVFRGITEKDAVAWNAALTAYTRSGHVEAAVELFREMLQEGMQPSRATFLSLLSANGAVSSTASWVLFSDFFGGDYPELPCVDHYVCLIDHLARAGLLEEAEELVLGMPVDADVVCWRALLNACALHNDTERAKRALDKVCEMDVSGTSCSYVQMCNMFKTS